MEQYSKIVFKHQEGYDHVATKAENGDLIVQIVPISEKTSRSSENEVDKVQYFTKISESDRNKVKSWLETRNEDDGVHDCQKQFLRFVRRAVESIDYDYWIATLEPSVEDGKIYYAVDESVGIGFECKKWYNMALEYAPNRGSRMAKLIELFLWYAVRIVDGEWTLEYVTRNSSSSGNYKNAPNATNNMEKTGARSCGGYKDGQGNSYKIVIVTEDNLFGIVGGDYYNDGAECPVATVFFGLNPYLSKEYGSGVVVLTK